MGQGVHTVLGQIACAELGLPPARLTVRVDTERELDTGETTASRATMLGGRAVIEAARKLRAALGDRPIADLAGLPDLVGREFGGEVVVDWTTPVDAVTDEPVTHFAYGWATQVVTLDADGRIERVIAAHDVGRILNRTLLEGQVEGGVHMGLGQALSEAFVVEGGVPVTDTLKSLGVIPASGMPPVDVLLIEEPQPEGPYGAKGMGEAVLVPTAAAVAGALYRYDGIRRTALPMRDSPAARAAVPRLTGPRSAALPAARSKPSGVVAS
jgi:aldehyde oxidoreductase